MDGERVRGGGPPTPPMGFDPAASVAWTRGRPSAGQRAAEAAARTPPAGPPTMMTFGNSSAPGRHRRAGGPDRSEWFWRVVWVAIIVAALAAGAWAATL